MRWIHRNEIAQVRRSEGVTPSPPKPKPSSLPPSNRLFLHVDMDAFFASVEERDHPELKDHPVAVGGGGTGNKGIVTAANYTARKFGIKAGMAAFEAKRRCPQIIFVGLDARKYTYASAMIMDLLEEFSDDVKVHSVDEASMDITDYRRRFDCPESFGLAVKRAIKERLNLPSTVGIASNRLVAKVAADSAKPDGLRFIDPGSEAAFLRPMPVGKMCGIGPATEQALARFGYKTLGELAAAPEDMMKLRFGVVGHWLVKMARGEYVGRMQQDDARGTEEKSMGHERTFAAAISDRDDLRAWVVALSEMVARRVRQGDMVGNVLTMRLRYSDFETLTHQSVLPEFTDDEEMIILFGWRLLDQCWESGRPVRLLGLSLGHLRPKSEDLHQMDLFRAHNELRREVLYKTLDSLKDRFGEKVILRAIGSRWRNGREVIPFGKPK